MVDGARIRLFATAREAVGREELVWPVPSQGIPLGGLLRQLGERYHRLRPVLPTCRFFVNGELVRPAGRRRLARGDEVAVHPPYSGG